jgi:8-hydroxy-5-deazaflavin:NADPH oxidoreductase
MPSAGKPVLALIGGTGPEGSGLASRFAAVGYRTIIGSRSRERAAEVAAGLSGAHNRVEGKTNADAAREADIVILTIPYRAIDDTIPMIANLVPGKIVVSAVAPVEFREGRPVALRPEAGSAAQEIAQKLPRSRVVSAFQNVDSHALATAETLDTDIIVTSDDAEARHEVMALVAAFPGARALSGGRLAAARYVEEITALLITLNRIYKAHSGIRITGIAR